MKVNCIHEGGILSTHTLAIPFRAWHRFRSAEQTTEHKEGRADVRGPRAMFVLHAVGEFLHVTRQRVGGYCVLDVPDQAGSGSVTRSGIYVICGTTFTVVLCCMYGMVWIVMPPIALRAWYISCGIVRCRMDACIERVPA